MASFNPYEQYLNVQFQTADQGKLILMAYDGALRYCRLAQSALQEGNKAAKGDALARAYDIVAELRSSLRPDLGGEIAQHLNRAYTFIANQITLANVMNRSEYIGNAILMLEKMREAWQEIVNIPSSGAQPTPQPGT